MLESVVLPPPVEELRVGYPTWLDDAAIGPLNFGQLLRLSVGEWAQHHRIHDAENGGVGAMASASVMITMAVSPGDFFNCRTAWWRPFSRSRIQNLPALSIVKGESSQRSALSFWVSAVSNRFSGDAFTFSASQSSLSIV